MVMFHNRRNLTATGISLLLVAATFDCSPYLRHSYSETHTQTMLEPECDRPMSDSVMFVFAGDPRRAKEEIVDTIMTHENAIAAFFDKQKPGLKAPDSFQIGLAIDPNGRFAAFQKGKSFVFDTAKASLLNGVLNRFKFDSIPSYPLTVRFTINLKYQADNRYAVSVPDSFKYGEQRSKASIMQIVMLNLAYLRYAYNWRLRQHPGLKGKITVKFALGEKGKVFYCKIIESTVHDTILENDVAAILKTWKFCPIRNPGDTTEVIYPFIFSQ
jgi:TonB family protein